MAHQQPAAPSPELSLAEFFHLFVRPRILRPQGASEATLAEYGQALRRWIAITGDPPIWMIDAATCAAFVAGLQARPGRWRACSARGEAGLSPNTIRKYAGEIQHVLDLAGPRTRDNRRGLGVVDDVPYIERPKPWHKPPEDVFTRREIDAWLAAAIAAELPDVEGVRPAAWWRALIEYLFHTGLRISSALGVRYADHCRDDEGLLWLVLPAAIAKGHRGQRLYVNSAAAAAIERIRTDRELVFPWPHCRRRLDRERTRLLVYAGLPPERRFGFHALRKAMASEVAADNPLVAQKQAGHTGLAMTRDAYCRSGVVVETMERLAARGTGKARGTRRKIDPRQRTLFEV